MNLLKLFVVALATTSVALLTQEPGAVGAAFAAVVAALYCRRPRERCLRR